MQGPVKQDALRNREVRGCSIRSEGIYCEMQLANSGRTRSQRALQDHSGTYGLDSKNKA